MTPKFTCLVVALIRFGVSIILLLMMLGHMLGEFQIDVFVTILGIAICLVWFGPYLIRHVSSLELAGVKITTKDTEPVRAQIIRQGMLEARPSPNNTSIGQDERGLDQEGVGHPEDEDSTLNDELVVESSDSELRYERPSTYWQESEIPLFFQLYDASSVARLTVLRPDIERQLRNLANGTGIHHEGHGIINLVRSLKNRMY